jgi:hypothetical protein
MVENEARPRHWQNCQCLLVVKIIGTGSGLE